MQNEINTATETKTSMNFQTVTLAPGLDINIPVGPIVEPSASAQVIVNAMQNAGNWKLPTSPFVTKSADRAREIADALDFYMGGHEMSVERNGFVVTSKGYYHYIGA